VQPVPENNEEIGKWNIEKCKKILEVNDALYSKKWRKRLCCLHLLYDSFNGLNSGMELGFCG
jgi:hypothetical protein